MVNAYLSRIMEIKQAPKSIVEAMKYSLFAGGKRIRPVLSLAICEALGGNPGEVLPFACSIEMIHTYSLIHDDLPAMDNDDLRRGKPTSHKVFGEAKAILAGDALLNYAFESMLGAAQKESAGHFKACRVIAEASGVMGMIGGQVIDIESEGRIISFDRLLEMHRMKTGALIEAACSTGCILADREDLIEEVKVYSTNLGIAFQIVDDILDCEGDQNVLGKTTGKDRDGEKSTFVSIEGLQRSKEMAHEYSKTAWDMAKKLDASGFLPQLTEYLLNRRS
jgi:geranylgeranyl diphosphate synthase type II